MIISDYNSTTNAMFYAQKYFCLFTEVKETKGKYLMFNTVLLHVNLISSFILLVMRGINLHPCKNVCTNFPGCHPPFSYSRRHTL